MRATSCMTWSAWVCRPRPPAAGPVVFGFKHSLRLGWQPARVSAPRPSLLQQGGSGPEVGPEPLQLLLPASKRSGSGDVVPSTSKMPVPAGIIAAGLGSPGFSLSAKALAAERMVSAVATAMTLRRGMNPLFPRCRFRLT